jgi:hypothetical protein
VKSRCRRRQALKYGDKRDLEMRRTEESQKGKRAVFRGEIEKVVGYFESRSYFLLKNRGVSSASRLPYSIGHWKFRVEMLET